MEPRHGRPIVSGLVRLLTAAVLAIPIMAGTAAPAMAATECFRETGFCLEGRFLDYWRANGGLIRNGFPIGPELLEEGPDGSLLTVQYLERVRLEYHPENRPPFDILLGHFGRAVRPADPPAQPRPGPDSVNVYFTETGHNLGGAFLNYWRANGGLPHFGFPISEVFEERLEDGKNHQVQYFERARMEMHPDNKPPYDILLALLGQRIFDRSLVSPPRGLSACPAAALSARTMLEGAAGQRIGTITLTNQSMTTCWLLGHPSIAPVDSLGQTLAVELTDEAASCYSRKGCAPVSAVVLPLGAKAMLQFSWSNYCGRSPNGGVTNLRLTLPSLQGSINAPVQGQNGGLEAAAPPPCNGPGQPSTLRVRPFTAALNPGTQTVMDFYDFINAKSYRNAYDLLGPALQEQQPYRSFVAGFNTTVRDTIAIQTSVLSAPNNYVVALRLQARQSDGSTQRFRGTYAVLTENADADNGRLIDAAIELDE